MENNEYVLNKVLYKHKNLWLLDITLGTFEVNFLLDRQKKNYCKTNSFLSSLRIKNEQQI